MTHWKALAVTTNLGGLSLGGWTLFTFWLEAVIDNCLPTAIYQRLNYIMMLRNLISLLERCFWRINSVQRYIPKLYLLYFKIETNWTAGRDWQSPFEKSLNRSQYRPWCIQLKGIDGKRQTKILSFSFLAAFVLPVNTSPSQLLCKTLGGNQAAHPPTHFHWNYQRGMFWSFPEPDSLHSGSFLCVMGPDTGGKL